MIEEYANIEVTERYSRSLTHNRNVHICKKLRNLNKDLDLCRFTLKKIKFASFYRRSINYV